MSASKPAQRPILVTGAHRTGTTWVGKMLAANQQVAYISEPLNLLHRPGVMNAPVGHWYPYINHHNADAFLPALQDTLSFRYHLWAEIRSLRSLKDFLRMGRDWGIFLQGRLYHQRPLLKDPFAFFSAPWFASQLNCQVIITIRHPLAFASSLKRLNWPFDFNDLLSQPQLMADWLEPFRDEIAALQQDASTREDIIAQGSLLWRLIYSVVRQYAQEYPEFQVVRHEDLSLDPIHGFQALYSSLDLQFTERTEAAIMKSTSAGNPQELSRQKMHATRLDSRANLDNWKRRLEKAEIERVQQLTQDIAAHFYPDHDW